MRRTPAAGLLEYIIPLLYLPVFTIWVSATKQASHTHKLFFSVWVSAIKQASHTHKLFSAWVSATKQASHTLKLFIVWVSATKQASHTLKLSTAWVSATKQAFHTHKLFTLRQKKGTEKLDTISCAHTEAKEWVQAELVRSTAILRYEPCPQFINVSQRALHIYWQFSAMSHAIHKIVSKRRCQSYFISRRSPHHGISKDSDLCASAHRCL